ncbi:UPF0261 domain protein [Pestalotiopsis sp. NC0098]|nr:UPF0261 domain protein [Pestalotiopsis sp. NC0098]
MSKSKDEEAGPRILLLATCDTKMEEIAFIHDRLTSIDARNRPILMDIGRTPASNPLISISHRDIFSRDAPSDLSSLPRDEYSSLMIEAATAYVRQHLLPTSSSSSSQQQQIHAVLGIGGSTGSSIIAAVMRAAAPVGLPKLLVSTMASGDVGPLVGGADMTLMYSVTDIAGLNFLSERVLGNAAAAAAGMAASYFKTADQGEPQREQGRRKKRIAVTMFGVTTPGVDAIRSLLSARGAEVVVFHATGSGGRAMEALVRQGEFDGVVDLTTTEIADEVGGGVLSAGPDRLAAGAAAAVPMVVSVGACDMVNFGPRGTVSAELLSAADRGERKLYVHNPMVTLLRTTREENARIAEFMVDKLSKARRKDLVKVILPTEGISMISGKGGPFEDREADEALFRGIEDGLKGSGIDVIKSEGLGINDQEFAQHVVKVLGDLGLP